jgi:hypothetical protein
MSCQLHAPGSFTPWERALGANWIGGWVDPRVCLDDMEKLKFLIVPVLELQPLCCPARRQSLYRLRYRVSLNYVYIRTPPYDFMAWRESSYPV